MARLTKEQWAAARATWEADARPGFDWLSADLGVSRQSVSEMAKRKEWTKHDGNPAQENAVENPAQEKSKNPAQEKTTAKAAPASKSAGQGKGSKPHHVPVSEPEKAAWLLDEKRPRGRPTEYRDEFIDMMLEFFDIEVQKVETIEVTDSNGVVKSESRVVTSTYPTLERFASKIGITRETLHDWATATDQDGALRRPDFSYIYMRAKDLQSALLIEGGMAGIWEGRFAALAAKNIAGWKDQIEQKIESNVTRATVDELEALYADKMAAAEQKRLLILDRRAKLNAQ